MEHSRSWDSDSRSVVRQIHRILWNPKIHYRYYVYKNTTTAPYSVHTLKLFRLKSTLILSFHLRPDLPTGLFPSGLPTKFYIQTDKYFLCYIKICVERSVFSYKTKKHKLILCLFCWCINKLSLTFREEILIAVKNSNLKLFSILLDG